MSNIVTLLVDTDIVAYKEASMNQTKTSFGTVTDFKNACAGVDTKIAQFAEKLKADRVIMCLSDGDFGGTSNASTTSHNFRFGVLPTYKGNRKSVERPELLKDLKQFVFDEYVTAGLPACEAADVMGIYATHPTLVEGVKIIVSEDKDLRTIPARVYAPHRENLGVQNINVIDADRFHMWQTICGDTTDGYKGAHRVGPKSVYAEEIIAADSSQLWDITFDAFASVGMNETDAITQARVARILRSEDYDLSENKVLLWTPELLLKDVWNEQ